MGQWEGQLDWKLLLAECTLHYLFVCMLCFCFCFCFFLLLLLFLSSFFIVFFHIASSIVLSALFFFFFLLYCNHNYKLGLSTIYVQYYHVTHAAALQLTCQPECFKPLP